jgi:hypothetical protein
MKSLHVCVAFLATILASQVTTGVPARADLNGGLVRINNETDHNIVVEYRLHFLGTTSGVDIYHNECVAPNRTEDSRYDDRYVLVNVKFTAVKGFCSSGSGLWSDKISGFAGSQHAFTVYYVKGAGSMYIRVRRN